MNYTKLVSNGSGKDYYNFTIFLSLGSSAESIYNGSLSLKAAKIKEKDLENMLIKLDEYSPNKEKYKTLKTSTLLNARELYKGRKMIIHAFENDIFSLPKQPLSGLSDWDKMR